jgi:uncharacterized protein YbcI
MAEGELTTEEMERQLAQELLHIHETSYGKGAEHARAHILDDLVICLLDGVELLPNEEFLIKAGRGDAVLDIRTRYQQAIETTFRAAVERVTGQRVVSFASQTNLEPNYVMETFRLGPNTSSTLEEPGDG